jgi:hypothetical protein
MTPSGEQTPVAFVRVVDPIDPWLEEGRHLEQVEQFIGRYLSISVAMTSRCCECSVLASFHGARNEVGELNPTVFRFSDFEVARAGGRLVDTDAIPPWPGEYNHAHHDITEGQRSVAIAMVGHYKLDRCRLVHFDETDILIEIAKLLQREDVDPRFNKYARKRLRRLFRDGGNFREIWLAVAMEVPAIIEDDNIKQQFRRIWSSERAEWIRISGKLPQISCDPVYSTG